MCYRGCTSSYAATEPRTELSNVLLQDTDESNKQGSFATHTESAAKRLPGSSDAGQERPFRQEKNRGVTGAKQAIDWLKKINHVSLQ